MNERESHKTMCVRVPIEIHKELKIMSINETNTMTKIINKAIVFYIDSDELRLKNEKATI